MANELEAEAPAFEHAARVCACGALLVLGAVAAASGARAGRTHEAVHAATPSRPSSALDAFARAWSGVTGYTATVTVFEQKDNRVQNVGFNYSFRKPSNVTVYVVAGTNAGVTLVWDGGTSVVVHRGSGIRALFKKTLSLHDPQVTTIRGSSIDELSFGRILTHARNTPGTLSLGRRLVIGGVAAETVTLLPANPVTNAALTREVIEISTKTHLPMRVLGYQGRTLVRKIDYSNVTLAH
jgi:outer membrane lipoprotein-sorting protein